MKRILIRVGGLTVAGALAIFPAQVWAHADDPHDEAKAIAAAMKKPLVVKGSAKVRIIHVVRGCHVWSNGKRQAAGLKVFARRGQAITITNSDIDMQQLTRIAGPKLALGKAMRMNESVTVRFATRGVYRLRTRSSMMPGMPEVKTIGADNLLPIVAVVR